MNNYWKRTLSFIVLILLIATIINLRYGDILHTDNNKFLDIWGDGFKNYVTVLYHIEHDSTYMHFGGMNYPYGEHVLFTDNQPILSNTLKFINTHFFEVLRYTPAIIKYAMFVSLLLSGIFLFLIFQRLSIPARYNIPVTIGLVFLSPQTMRFGAHFGLAYTFVIPLFIYLLMIFEERRSWKLSALIGLLVTFVAQLHFYYFGITAFLISFYFLFRLLGVLNWENVKFYGFHFLIQVFIPFILLKIWISIGNNVIDRPNSPLGFIFYRSYLESIFLMPDFGVYKWINEFIIKIRSVPWEGKAYIGVVSAITFLSLLIMWIKGKFKQPFWNFHDTKHEIFLNSLFKVSIIFLLFSMGFPFLIPGFGHLIEYTGPLKQFRGIGRFSWGFYYIINILVFVYLLNLINIGKESKVYSVFSVLIIFFLLNESAHFSANRKLRVWDLPELADNFQQSDGYWFKDIETTKYQAIFPVPYYHQGSENFDISTKGIILKNSLVASLLTGLPNMGVMMSRTSLSQSKKAIQFALAPYRMPEIFKDLPNKKPILIIADKKGMKYASPRFYRHFLNDKQKLFENKQIIIYEFQLADYQKIIDAEKAQIIREIKERKLFKTNNLFATDSTNDIIYKSFQDSENDHFYFTKGCFEGNFNKENVVFKGRLPKQQKGKKYTFSAWVYIGEDRYPRIDCKLREYDPQHPENEFQSQHLDTTYEMQAIDNDWALFEFSFDIKESNSELRITFQNKSDGSYPMWIDEVLIRPENVDVYKQGDDFVWKNNMHYK